MFQQTSGREATPYPDPALERERELVLLDWVGTTANDAWSSDRRPRAGPRARLRACRLADRARLPPSSRVGRVDPGGAWSLEEPGAFESFRRATDATTFAAGEGLPGRVLASGEPAWIADFSGDANYARAEAAADVGLRAAIAFPVLTGAEVVGVLEFFTDAVEEPDPSLLRLMAQVGKQLGRVVERERSREHIAHSTMHDSLTGLPTRALFLDRLAHAHARASRNGLGLVVLLGDVDDFQAVNRRVGHEGGDTVLAEVGRRLRAAVRASDAVARLGADQFAVLCEDAGAESPVRVIDRIGAALGEPVKVDGHRLVVTASLGVSSGSAQPDDPVTLLREAETALEAAKSCGKDRCAVFNVGMRGRDRLRERDEIEALLARDGSIVPVFQPIVDLRTGIVAGYEALARFRTSGPSRPPNLWFAQAYRCGLGVRSSRRRDCARSWPCPGREPALTCP